VRASVYVDGFNLYHAALKGTPYKWLDLRRLASFLLPNDGIHRIRYFTARPVYYPGEQPKGQRLQAYIRALETLPRLSVHLRGVPLGHRVAAGRGPVGRT
jgi:hypothetical protein